MTIPLIVAGTTYNFPAPGDLSWGLDVTSWASAITNNQFPQTGGSYNLSGDVNFGNTNGFTLQHLSSSTPTGIAVSGFIRMADSDDIVWKNPTGGADLVLNISPTGLLYFDGVPVASGGGGGIPAMGPYNFNGKAYFDTTSYTGVFPFVVTHSNVWLNSDPFGSGTVQIYASGQNNNQPLQYNSKRVNSTNFGNAANLILANSGGSYINTDRFGVDLEIVANNAFRDAYNGKNEIGVVSGNNTNIPYFYLASRRGPQHPGGANSGFEVQLRYYALTDGGVVESIGNGMTFNPQYDFGVASNFTMDNAFRGSNLYIRSSAGNVAGAFISSTGVATTETTGIGGTYARVTATAGNAFIYSQSNLADAAIEVRGSWSGAGTGSAVLNLFTGTNEDWRIMANGVNGRLNIRNTTSGIKESISVDPATDGRVTVYAFASNLLGELQLGSGGGVIGYDGTYFTFDKTFKAPLNVYGATSATFTITAATGNATVQATSTLASSYLNLVNTAGHDWRIENRLSDGVIHWLDNGSTVATFGGASGIESAVTSATGRFTFGFGTAYIDYGTINANRFTMFSASGSTFIRTQKTQVSSPSATGQTTVVGLSITDVVMLPGGAYATHTLTLPTTPIDGITVSVTTTQTVTTLTANSADGTAIIKGPTGTLTADTNSMSWFYNTAANTWYRKS